MDAHKNARSVAASRALLIERYERHGWSLADAAFAIGISERRAWTWLARHRAGESLQDRSSAPHVVRRIGDDERDRIVELRRLHWTCRRIARSTGRSVSTVARVLKRAGLSRLRDVDGPPPPVARYEHECAGDMLHIDIKKLGRITGGGGLNRHDRPGRSRGGGWEYVHVCVDDATRLAYSEIMPDERA